MTTTDDKDLVVPGWRRRQAVVWGTTRSLIWAVVAMLGGGLMAVSTFLPWLERSGLTRREAATVRYSGWDLYDLRRAGENGLLVHHPFARSSSFPSWLDWFATGPVVFALGLVVVLAAGLLLMCNWRLAPPVRWIVRAAIVAPAALGITVALLVTTLNVVLPIGIARYDLAYGLGLAWLGAMVSVLGVAFSAGPTGRALRRARLGVQ